MSEANHPPNQDHPADNDPQDRQVSDEQDQQLVAYLDGELAEADRLLLEEQLVSNDRLRKRLAQLQSGWEMLDYLPPATVTEDFARTTVEMIAAGESRVLVSQPQGFNWRRFLWAGIAVVATLISAGVGYAIPDVLANQRLKRQLDRLPLAENLDAYMVPIDLETIEQLSQDPNWQEAMRLGRNAGGIIVNDPLQLEARDYSEKMAVLENIGNEQRAELSRNWERLSQLPEERLLQLQSRAESVSLSREPQKLLRTFSEFAAWYAQLPPEVQTQIQKAESSERYELVLNLVDKSEDRWVTDFGTTLNRADREIVYELLRYIAEDRITQVKAFEPPDNRLPPFANTPEELMQGWSFAWSQRRSSSAERRSMRVVNHLFARLSDDELKELEEVIGPSGRLVLRNVESVEEYRETLTQWCVSVIQRMSPVSSSAESMERVYEWYGVEDRNDRERLDLLPPDDIYRELDRRFFRPRPSR